MGAGNVNMTSHYPMHMLQAMELSTQASMLVSMQAAAWASMQWQVHANAAWFNTQSPSVEMPGTKSRTTAMLRNVPNNYTRDMLLASLDSEGFAGKYDFLYLPIDYATGAGLGF